MAKRHDSVRAAQRCHPRSANPCLPDPSEPRDTTKDRVADSRALSGTHRPGSQSDRDRLPEAPRRSGSQDPGYGGARPYRPPVAPGLCPLPDGKRPTRQGGVTAPWQEPGWGGRAPSAAVERDPLQATDAKGRQAELVALWKKTAVPSGAPPSSTCKVRPPGAGTSCSRITRARPRPGGARPARGAALRGGARRP